MESEHTGKLTIELEPDKFVDDVHHFVVHCKGCPTIKPTKECTNKPFAPDLHSMVRDGFKATSWWVMIGVCLIQPIIMQ